MKKIEALQGILDLYKEKEKNKKLENADLTTVYMDGFYDGEKKWKDKIKAKIEEYKKPVKFKEIDEYGEIIEGTMVYQDKIEVLQELLKGGKLSNE